MLLLFALFIFVLCCFCFYPTLWAILLYTLLENYLNKIIMSGTKIVIDNEFDGHQRIIKIELLRLIKKKNKTFVENKLVIKSIGKKSPAHFLAWATNKGKRKPDTVITQEKFLRNVL